MDLKLRLMTHLLYKGEIKMNKIFGDGGHSRNPLGYSPLTGSLNKRVCGSLTLTQTLTGFACPQNVSRNFRRIRKMLVKKYTNPKCRYTMVPMTHRECRNCNKSWKLWACNECCEEIDD